MIYLCITHKGFMINNPMIPINRGLVDNMSVEDL